MLPSTISGITTRQSGAGSTKTFSNPVVIGNTAQFTGVSPQGDLVGRPVLTMAHEKLKSGIVSSKYQLIVPRYISADVGYKGYRTVTITLKCSEDDSLAAVDEALSLLVTSLSFDNGNPTGQWKTLGDAFVQRLI